MGGPPQDVRDGVRALAIQRVIALPVIALVAFLQEDAQVVPLAVLSAIFAVSFAAQTPKLLGRDWQRVPLVPLLVIDVLGMAAAIALSGGAESEVRFVAPLVLFLATYCLPPRTMLGFCGLLVASCGTVVAIDAWDEPRAVETIAEYLAVLVLVALITYQAAAVRERASSDLRHLAAARRRLLADSAGAELRDRRRISQELHDDALQSLLAARQDLEEAETGDVEALRYARAAVDRSVEAVRDLVYEIHPAALAGSGLPAALQSLAVRSAKPDGPSVQADVDPRASSQDDDLLHAVARELVSNAVRHSGAARVDVRLRSEQDAVLLEVADDGHGLPPAEERRPGAIGLAAAAARVDVAGGRMEVETSATGTTVTVVVPAARSVAVPG